MWESIRTRTWGPEWIAKIKNSDMVCLGFNNVDGIPAKVTNNSKVNAIRRYALKNELDGVFGVEANINWKKCQTRGNSRSCFILKMPFAQWHRLIGSKTMKENSKAGLLA
jgi:hypothetical protein